MDAVVRLRHVTRAGDWRMYFYDGELPVEGSVLTIPADRPEWIQRAWIQGFRMTAEGRVIADLAKHIRAETAPVEESVTHNDVGDDFVHVDSPECLCLAPVVTDEVAEARLAADKAAAPVDETENAESVEESTEDDEGPDRGGQPAGEDGVRSSEPDRDEGDAGGGDAGSGSSEPAEG